MPAMARKAKPEKPKPRAKSEIDTMWIDFKRTGSVKLREELIGHYWAIGLVHSIAEKVQRRTPLYLRTIEDLAAEGAFGLMASVDRFQPERGFLFSTYATPRIRGAMIDSLRSNDPVPRRVRQKQKEANRLAEGGMNAEDALDAAEVTAHERQLLRPLRSLEDTVETKLDYARPLNLLSTRGPAVLNKGVLKVHRSERFEALTRGLLFEEKLILWLYYHTEVTMREIGALLHLSESRVSQKHSQLIAFLRNSRTLEDVQKGLFQ